MLSLLVLYQADVTIVNVAAPSIHEDLGASGAEVELVVGAYLLASATLLITGARLGHLHGYRRVFLAGVAVFGLASLCCGLATDPATLIAARMVQGIGGALAFPQVLTAIQVHFPDGRTRGQALGRYAIALAAGAVAGQIAGGVLVSADLFGWRWRPIFLINVLITLIVVLAGLRVIPHDVPRERTRRLDVPGAASLSATLLLIVLPLTLGRQAGWPAWTGLCLAASTVTGAFFLAVQRRRTVGERSPLVDLRLIRRPAIAWGLAAQATVTATYYALLFTLAQYMQRGLGHGAVASGLVLLPWVVMFGLPGQVLGRLSAPSARRAVPIGYATLAAAYAGLAACMLTGSRPIWMLLIVLAAGGLGLGTSFSAMLVHLTEAATPLHAADISGIFTTSLQIAGLLGVASFGSLYLSRVHAPGPEAASRAFGTVAAAFAATALVAVLAGWRAIRTAPRDTSRVG